jgi:hypothetical protein
MSVGLEYANQPLDQILKKFAQGASQICALAKEVMGTLENFEMNGD